VGEQRTIIPHRLLLGHPSLSEPTISRKLELPLREGQCAADDLIPIDLVSLKVRNDERLNRLVYNRTTPCLYGFKLAKQERFAAQGVPGIVPSRDIGEVQLPRASAHSSVGRKRPVKSHLSRLLDLLSADLFTGLALL